ncbi:MAG TPA: hypothetical protein VGB05_00055 [Pyrinomonadaceae bacterium]|jgi:hypothetical protein
MKVSDNVFPKLRLAEVAAPATPAAGELVVYAKADGKLYYKNDDGTERAIGVAVNSIIAAASDETTAITAGTAKLTFRMPYAMLLTDVRASLTTPQTGGSVVTVDVNENGASILSTKLTIDNGEKTSTTAATPRVISDANLADDAEITIDVDQVGDGTAKGLKVSLIGVPV